MYAIWGNSYVLYGQQQQQHVVDVLAVASFSTCSAAAAA